MPRLLSYSIEEHPDLAGVATLLGPGNFVQNVSQPKVTVNWDVGSAGLHYIGLKIHNGVTVSTTMDPLIAEYPIAQAGASIPIELWCQDLKGVASKVTKYINVLPYTPANARLVEYRRGATWDTPDDYSKRLWVAFYIHHPTLPFVQNAANNTSANFIIRVANSNVTLASKSINGIEESGIYKVSFDNIDPDDFYEIKAVVGDEFSYLTGGRVPTATSTPWYEVSSTFNIFDFHKSGTGLAIGAVMKYPNAFHMHLPSTFKKSVTFEDSYNVKPYEPTLFNQFEEYNPDYIKLTVWKDAFGYVHFKGNLRFGGMETHPNYKKICNLPAELRPSKMVYGPVATGSFKCGFVAIASNGDVSLRGCASSWICFDGVKFMAES